MNRSIQVVAPYDQSPITDVALNSPEDVDRMLADARDVFLDHDRRLRPHERSEILTATAALMVENKEELVEIATREGGKPRRDTAIEVDRAIQGVEVAVHELHRHAGAEIPMGLTRPTVNRLAMTHPEPIGVVAAISAFNHPLNLIVHQTIPAIAVGSPVIIKPALTTPLSCLRLIEIYRDAGLDEVWCRAAITDNETAEMLATDPRISYLSFIGSASVGWALRSKVAPGTRVGLEHGGIAPVIVEPDADLAEVGPAVTKGGLYHAGQVCVSVQRVFAHDSIARDLADEVASRAASLTVGDPLSSTTDVGPMITTPNVERIESWVQEAISMGAELLSGGERLSDSCYAPTVLFNPPPEARVSHLEIFGPVICVYDYQNRREAIDRANDTPLAFQASVFTKDIDKALDTANRLNASAVMINDHPAFRADWMPFGGRDQSGLGMGGIPYTMREMTREKMVVVKSNAV